ncbi:MAG: hypothetical protein R2697_00520 [Ilumatobacteraceae bacterium]
MPVLRALLGSAEHGGEHRVGLLRVVDPDLGEPLVERIELPL